jgi:hypothetical protein
MPRKDGTIGIKEAKRALRAYLRGNILEQTYYQDRPYTLALITVSIPTREAQDHARTYNEIGFSKVCWPDVWSKQEGERVARERALSKLTKRIWNGVGFEGRSLIVRMLFGGNELTEQLKEHNEVTSFDFESIV